MTHIRSALAGAMLVFGAGAVASAQQQTPAAPTPQAQHTRQMHRGPGRQFGGQRALFKGITLSDGEKANIKAVQAKYEPQLKALREQSKPQMDAMRAARQRGDTAAVRQMRQQMRQQNTPQRQQAMQLMQSERTDLRNALTPANQVTFDANAKKFKQRATKRGGRAWNKSGQRASTQAPTTGAGGSTRG